MDQAKAKKTIEKHLGEPINHISELGHFLQLYVNSGFVTFENLSKLSDLFGTKMINVGNGQTDQYYGTGSFFTVIEIRDITKWDEGMGQCPFGIKEK